MPIEFAYAQARIQARNGQRPSKSAWQSLAASQSLSHFLHALRGTSLSSSIAHLTEKADAHLIERSLREDWRGQMNSLASWIPARWQDALLWFTTLPDLPAVTYLLRGGPAFAWMREDLILRPIATTDSDARLQVLAATKLSPLANSFAEDGMPITDWISHWRSLWPGKTTEQTGLDALVQIFSNYLDFLRSAASSGETASKQDSIENQLARMTRSHRQQPAAMFSFVGLLALDLQRLRGELVRRALFVTPGRN